MDICLGLLSGNFLMVAISPTVWNCLDEVLLLYLVCITNKAIPGHYFFLETLSDGLF